MADDWESRLREESESLSTNMLRAAVERAESIAISSEASAISEQQSAEHWREVHRIRKEVLDKRLTPAAAPQDGEGR